MSKIVFSFGEVLWDILPNAVVLGGAPLNFAYRIHSLGNTGYMISRLGRDELGIKAHQTILGLGLADTFVQWDDHHPTGTVNVSFDADMNPDYVINPGVAYDHIELVPSLADAIVDADCLCFGTLAQRSAKARETLMQLVELLPYTLLFLDINLRKACYSPDTIAYSLDKADILKLNGDEAKQLASLLGLSWTNLPGFCERIVSSYHLDYCLVTLAELGAYVQAWDDRPVYVPGYQVNLVDSLGSGDAFSAGFIHSILQGQPVREACEFGNLLGAIVATQQGATVPISEPDRAQFIATHAVRSTDPSLEAFL
jgi:fructokinase